MELKSARAVEVAAWKIKNLEDYEKRLEQAAVRIDELNREHDVAALIIYEAALMKSGRPVDDVRALVRSFRQTWEDEEEPLSIHRVSSVMRVEGDEWFFGDPELRVLTGQLLGQFQHRSAQYNYIDEREVLRRWADSYDTRLFIRRRIYDTEPIVGVISGFDLPLMQYLRVIAGGNTAIPTPELAQVLNTLNVDGTSDNYTILAHVESLALYLDLPAPVVAEILTELVSEGRVAFPEPPAELFQVASAEDEEPSPDAEAPSKKRMSPEERAARRAARRGEAAVKGEEPTKVQDAQYPEAPPASEMEGTDPAVPDPREGDEASGTADKESS